MFENTKNNTYQIDIYGLYALNKIVNNIHIGMVFEEGQSHNYKNSDDWKL